MTGGIRLSVAVPGASASRLMEVARLADHWNVAALWLGDPWARAENRADSYVTAAAGAITALTSSLRLALVLGLQSEKQLVRLAEDVAVLDQASGGRIELALVQPGEDRVGWLERAAGFLRAWNEWALPANGETVPVIPGPAQPVVPRVVVGDEEIADALGAGRLTRGGTSAARSRTPLGPRTILAVELDLDRDGVRGWLEFGPYERVAGLRNRADEAGAGELLAVLTEVPSEADMEAIGTVLVPSLRAASRDARAIATDSWTWLTEKADLHRPPPEGKSPLREQGEKLDREVQVR